MPLSDVYGPEDALYQEFLAWRRGVWQTPWDTGEGGTKQAAGQEAGGGSATIARGSKPAGGGAGSQLMDDLANWRAGIGGQDGSQADVTSYMAAPSSAYPGTTQTYRSAPYAGGVSTGLIPLATGTLARSALAGTGVGKALGLTSPGPLTSPGNLGIVGGAGVQGAGVLANALGAPPGVSFGLG